MTAAEVYEGSDGKVTTAYYSELVARCGVMGEIAVNLFRAQKCSYRAKLYRGRMRGKCSFKAMAYDRKQWSMNLLCCVLKEHGSAVGITWGWKKDSVVVFGDEPSYVLYVDLPEGQCSFHSPMRGEGPDYPGEWDGLQASCARILAFCDRVYCTPDPRQMELAG